MKTGLLQPILVFLFAASALFPTALLAQTSPRNILLVLADDVGTDALSIFNTNTSGVSFAPTPNLDALAKQGVIFRNCYGYPSCSPTRSAILTGRYGFRTGIGAAIGNPEDPYLSPRDFTIAKALNANPQLGIHHAHIGKWHLSTNAIDPNSIGGWSHFSGFLAGELADYYNWEKTVNGTTTANYTNYATSDNATEAINWIDAQGTNRWFLWFAPKAAHSPYHKPPNELHTYDYLDFEVATNEVRPYYEAMIEALDTELGRVLATLNLAETMVVFLGDNGTPTEVIQSPYKPLQAKGTLTEGGIRIPMFIAGAGVVGTNRSSTAVVHAVDLFATLLEFAGVNLATTMPTNLVFDSRSFAAEVRNEPWNPAENVILSENFGSILLAATEGVAARGLRYKVVKLDSGHQQFYDLQDDPYANTNLLGAPNDLNNLTSGQRAAYSGLTNRLAGWHNYPVAPTITKVQEQAGALALTVPEQLGIAYGLARTPNLNASNWAAVTNFRRQILTNEAAVTVIDPTPTAPAFYRVTAEGR